jgi:NAD(P)-dependent dehydrogenase (short-subunit alcohol dehydrogenase family)
MSLDDFRLVVDVHLMGAAVCAKAVWGIMREQGYGRIVMTTSSSGLYGNFGQANYGAAKLALVGLMQTLAIEGEKYDIRVNCLAPTAPKRPHDAKSSSAPAPAVSNAPGWTGLPGLIFS